MVKSITITGITREGVDDTTENRLISNQAGLEAVFADFKETLLRRASQKNGIDHRTYISQTLRLSPVRAGHFFRQMDSTHPQPRRVLRIRGWGIG